MLQKCPPMLTSPVRMKVNVTLCRPSESVTMTPSQAQMYVINVFLIPIYIIL